MNDPAPRLLALRQAGAPERAPVLWHHLQTLHTRASTEPPEVSAQLGQALDRALRACETALAAAGEPPAARSKPTPARHGALAALNAHVRQRHEHIAREAALAGESVDPSELASLRRFRASWSRFAAQDQVAQAITRLPDQAGPLNSHALVLRSLALMRDLSPDYLRRFLAQLDALMWLDDLAQRPPARTPRAARRPTAAK